MEQALDEKPLHEILGLMVKDAGAREIKRDELAKQIGVHSRVLSFWVEGVRKCPVEQLPKICRALKDYRILDELESRAGRVAFEKPHIESSDPMADVAHVQRLVSEVGGALEELGKTLADGVVEQHELKKVLPELDHVIRECVRLQHWLRRREEHDRRRRK